MTLNAGMDARALTAFLREFPERVRRDIINSAASAGATYIRKQAKKNIEQNGSVESGGLRDSMRTRKKRGMNGIYQIFSTAPHAHLVEWGTGPRKFKKPRQVRIGGKWVVVESTGSMPAKPFFRPAVDENHPEILRRMRERLARRMAAEAAKMNQRYSQMSRSYRKKLAK